MTEAGAEGRSRQPRNATASTGGKRLSPRPPGASGRTHGPRTLPDLHQGSESASAAFSHELAGVRYSSHRRLIHGRHVWLATRLNSWAVLSLCRPRKEGCPSLLYPSGPPISGSGPDFTAGFHKRGIDAHVGRDTRGFYQACESVRESGLCLKN